MSTRLPWTDPSPEARAFLRAAHPPARMDEDQRRRTTARVRDLHRGGRLLPFRVRSRGFALAGAIGLAAALAVAREVYRHRPPAAPAVATSAQAIPAAPARVPLALPPPAAPDPRAAAPTTPPVVLPASRPAPPRASAHPTVDPAPATPPEPGFSDEVALLGRAQRALAARPAEALDLADQHRALFAHPALAHERERIAIEALGRLGRSPEARRRAEAFLARSPESTVAPLVRQLLEGLPR